MPEDFDREAERQQRQQRHEDANADQNRGAPASTRAIAKEEVLRAMNDLGIDFGSFQGRNDFGQTMVFLAKLKVKETELNEALAYVRDRKGASKAGIKNVWVIVTGAVGSALAGVIGAIIARWGH